MSEECSVSEGEMGQQQKLEEYNFHFNEARVEAELRDHNMISTGDARRAGKELFRRVKAKTQRRMRMSLQLPDSKKYSYNFARMDRSSIEAVLLTLSVKCHTPGFRIHKLTLSERCFSSRTTFRLFRLIRLAQHVFYKGGPTWAQRIMENMMSGSLYLSGECTPFRAQHGHVVDALMPYFCDSFLIYERNPSTRVYHLIANSADFALKPQSLSSPTLED